MTTAPTIPHSPLPIPGSIAFIGGGNMARSLIGGLMSRGVAADTLRVAEPVAELRDALARDFGVIVFDNASDAVAGATLWLLAVKPQVMRQVCGDLSAVAQATRPLVVSIAAGITAAQLQRWLGGNTAIIRAMPNTPALLGAGVTGLYANAQVSSMGRDQAESLLASAGKTVWIDDEALMDAVTAVSGSGPAYVFLLAEAMEAAAKAEGLADDAARTLVLQTLLGAARMLTESGEDPAELRRRVTSPKGTTERAIAVLQGANLAGIFAEATDAALARSRELAAGA